VTRRTLSVVILGLGVSLLLLPAPVRAADEVDLSGKYKASGSDFSVKKNGEVYQVRWDYPDGKRWIGVGYLDGDRFSVAWDSTEGGNLGVAIYKVEKGDKGPKLVGRWASYNDKKATADTIEFVSK
jgi:hypothetical protein